MYLKLNHDNSTSTTFELIDLPEESGAWLRSVYDHLNIDILDVVPTVISGLFLVIDDMGKMYDGWEDRINSSASVLYGSPWDPIVGDAILCRRIGPELVPLSFQDVSYLEKFFNARFLKQTDRDREATFGG